MDLGFETIGNATLICFDRGPLLVTDPWTHGSAYFGSWIHQHQIPAEQMAHIQAAKYVWLSHGHPDHLSMESLEHLRHADILLPDHVGERIHRELRAAGFRTWILKDGLWVSLSDRVRVMCCANIFQDAVLLVDLGGEVLIANANDAGDRGAGHLVQNCVGRFKRSFLTALVAFGDADMIHMFDEDGKQIPPPNAERGPLQPGILGILDHYGITSYVPFATLHQYQRKDSLWTNAQVTRPEDMRARDASEEQRILPAYLSYDARKDEWKPIAPPAVQVVPKDPKDFGDDWEEPLHLGDLEKITAYFRRFEHFRGFLGFVEFRVGGRTHRIDIAPEYPRGVRFETPRGSLMTCVEWQIFDDLMIGNFTKTTLVGDWKTKNTMGMYPDFNPFLTKFGDNGGAHTAAELRAYFAEYQRRGFTAFDDRADSRELERALEPYLA
ncbi:MAG: MBL fold metallo-hydrolase [Planctomycetaceae bacterium]|nr:MBL fold metallo-hydrolase [Planctomycetaceae bacterium]